MRLMAIPLQLGGFVLCLSLDLLQLSEARQAGYLRAYVLAVDERQSVVNELLRYAVAFLVSVLATSDSGSSSISHL